MKTRSLILLSFFMMLIFLGCNGGNSQKPKTEKKGKLLAKMGKYELYSGTIDRMLEFMPEEHRDYFKSNENELKNYCLAYLQGEYLNDLAKDEGFLLQEELKKQLELFEFEKEQERKATIGIYYLQKKYFDNLKVSDEDLKEHFDKNRERLEEVSVAMIRLECPDNFSAAQKTKVKKKIKMIHSELVRNNGENFEELAKKYFEGNDSIKNRGGVIGKIKRNSNIDPEIIEVAFNLKKGEFSKPIKSRDSYTIVKVQDIFSFERQKTVIRSQLEIVKKREIFENIFSDSEPEFFLQGYVTETKKIPQLQQIKPIPDK